jgi:PBSX family phage terminase large subunit
MESIQLHPAQKTIANDTHRFRVVNCGRRFGKTVLACEEMIGVAIAKKNRRVIYYAPTREDAREIMWAMISKRCENIAIYTNESRLEMKIRTQDDGTSLIILYGWEALQERQKGRGLANDFIVLDEVSQYRNFWISWDEVLSPTLIDRKGSALFISTPKGFNHFYDLYNLREKNKDFASFHYTSYDNPFLPVSELEREKQTKPEDTFAQEFLADWRKVSGLVFKEFNRTNHVSIDNPKTVVDIVAGIDWGYTNPTSSHRIRIDADAHYWIDDEYYKTGRTTEQIIEAVKLKKPTKVFPDPAEPDRNEIANKMGLNVMEVSKDIVAGIDCLRTLFKQNRIHIHSDCRNLITELESYSYPDKKPDKNEIEKPIKENDHAIDEIRYVIYNLENNKVKDNISGQFPKEELTW